MESGRACDLPVTIMSSNSLSLRSINYQLDSMRWFSHRRRSGGRHNSITYLRFRKNATRGPRPRRRLPIKMAHFFGFCPRWPWPLTFDLDIRTRARFLYNAPNRQVLPSYV